MNAIFRYGLTFFVLCTLVLIFFHVDTSSDVLTAVLCLILSVCMVLPVFRKTFKVYEPYTIFFLLLLHGFSLQMAMMFVQTDKKIWEIDLNIHQDSSIFQFGLFCYIVAVFSFFLGYFNKYVKGILQGHSYLKKVRISSESVIPIIGVLSISALSFFLYFTSVLPEFSWFDSQTFVGKRFLEKVQENPWNYSGHIFQPNYIFYKIANLCSAIAIYLGVGFYKNVKLKNILLCFILLAIATNVLCSIIISDRSGILTTFLTMALIVYIQNEKVNYTRFYVFSIATAILIGIAMTTYRVEDNMPVSEVLNKTFFWTDFLDIKRSSYIINAVPAKVDYLYGESLVGWMALPIPRSMWENKPIYLEQSHIISQIVFKNKGRAGVYPGLISELYWNFNLLGIVCGFLSLGLLANLMLGVLNKAKKNPLIVISYVLFLTHLLFFSCSHSLGMGILKFSLVFLPILILSKFYLITNKKMSF